jgi:hypothetical protein
MYDSSASSTVKRLLRPLYGPPRAAFQYVRAARINRAYEAQYRQARRVYAASNGGAAVPLPPLADIGVRYLTGPDAPAFMRLPADWAQQVDALAADADRRFARTDECLFLPRVDRTTLPELTRDVPAVQSGQVISLQLRRPLDLDGLERLARTLLPPIEEHLFGTFVIADKVYAYRNLVGRQQAQVSWLWHYDNHPTPVMKVMVFLTDVDEGRAPLEYVRHAATKKPLIFKTRPLVGNSRVPPREVDAKLAAGYEVAQAIGPKGTILLFDDNVLHRATLARRAHRDIVVLQIRPATFRPERYIDPRWTGTFEHVDFNERPGDFTARPKQSMLSA